jgi:hypothetical protein
MVCARERPVMMMPCQWSLRASPADAPASPMVPHFPAPALPNPAPLPQQEQARGGGRVGAGQWPAYVLLPPTANSGETEGNVHDCTDPPTPTRSA